jgi:hypothetical protein
MTTANTTFKVCAIARFNTYKMRKVRVDGDNVIDDGIQDCTEEILRVEFLSGFAGYVIYRIIRRHGIDSAWAALPVAEARAYYRQIIAGKALGLPGADWQTVDPVTEIDGQIELEAREVLYSWGEGANRMAPVSMPAARCPVLRSRHYSTERTIAPQPFFAEFGGHSAHRIEWHELSRRYV